MTPLAKLSSVASWQNYGYTGSAEYVTGTRLSVDRHVLENSINSLRVYFLKSGMPYRDMAYPPRHFPKWL
jgi:hypothetical protein